jgi:hypothetical protein
VNEKDGGKGTNNGEVAEQQHAPSDANLRKYTDIMEQPVQEGEPDSLHGDWIRVERKKRNNKINARGGTQRGTFSNQHSGTVSPNMEGFVNMLKNMPKDNGYQVGSNQKSRMKFKKKRPRQDNIATNNNDMKANQPASGSSSGGVHAGRDTTIQGKDQFNKNQIGANSNFKIGVEANLNTNARNTHTTTNNNNHKQQPLGHDLGSETTTHQPKPPTNVLMVDTQMGEAHVKAKGGVHVGLVGDESQKLQLSNNGF